VERRLQVLTSNTPGGGPSGAGVRV